VKTIYTDDKGDEHEFLIDDSKVVGVEFCTSDTDGKNVKFLLASGKTLTLYLAFVNDEVWKQLKDYYHKRFV